MDNLPDPAWEEPKEAVWRSALRKIRSWKAPGRDGLCVFWWKNFHHAAAHLWKMVRGVVAGSVDPPDWFVRRRTVLLPKAGCQGKPDQYWPITCLNMAYKLLTSVVTTLLKQHVDRNSILPIEHKAMRKNRHGYLDALWLDSMISGEAKRSKRSLSVAWIDYSKTYDRVPHDWLRDMLESIRAPEPLRRCISTLIPTEFNCGVGRDIVKVEMAFRRGLFQGDSLLPLLFCLSIAPLLLALQLVGGFESRVLKGVISPTLFMNDLEVYATGKAALKRMLALVDQEIKCQRQWECSWV